jgi:hypothetical protein
MTNYTTNIDTVVLQIDCNTSMEQENIKKLILQWIESRKVATVIFDNIIKKYKLYHGGTTLATISTGYSNLKFYISIKFAGLKRYHERIDCASRNCLMVICALLNTNNNINFSLAELDIAIDAYCHFDNILVICTRKSPNVKYHGVGEVQEFNNVPTSYIENFDTRDKVKNASLRAYLYNKSAKENLPFNLTRFELKLQNRYFNRFGFDVQSILDSLSRYHIVYTNDFYEKKYIINKYNNYSSIAKREINRLGIEENRLYPDVNVILNFIKEIRSVYVNFYGELAFR